MTHAIHYNVSTLSEMDIYLFKQGSHAKLYEKFGSHMMEYKERRSPFCCLGSKCTNCKCMW